MYPTTMGGPPTPAVPIPGAAEAPGTSPWAPPLEAVAPTEPAADESEVEDVRAEDAAGEPAEADAASDEPDAEAAPAAATGPGDEPTAEAEAPAPPAPWIHDSESVQPTGAAAAAGAEAPGR